LNGIFAISLDFELHWGGFEKWPLDNHYKRYFLNTRNVIPEMLSLFAAFDVHVTWATVGMLFCKDRNELSSWMPGLKPQYQQAQLSAYNYIEHTGIGKDETDDPFHFAPSLIAKIIATPNQELATHTFAHYYCNEPDQTVASFRADLRAAQKAATKFDKRMTSLVFPRNQFNDQYLQACFEEGITAVRSNPLDWFWRINSTVDESYWKRFNRGVDAYFPVGKQNTFALSSLAARPGYPVCIPASRLLRPYNPKEMFLNEFKIARVCSEMRRAAQKGEVYHLWWHPHNFGDFPEESLKGLKKILIQFEQCYKTWNMSSLNMSEIVQRVNRAL
jgi:hypothetical protein